MDEVPLGVSVSIRRQKSFARLYARRTHHCKRLDYINNLSSLPTNYHAIMISVATQGWLVDKEKSMIKTLFYTVVAVLFFLVVIAVLAN